MKVLLNDPPLKRKGDKRTFVELDEILKCDIVTIHTPLNLTGVDKTHHLFDKSNLNKLINGAILINTSRGAVVNNLDLLKSIEKKNLKVILDVWENNQILTKTCLRMF
jgi:erythronate-4-phosphate dehydrogenase